MEVNSNSAQPTDSSETTGANVQRPGEYLSKIRLSKKLSLEEVSQEISIPVKTLQALEKDDYASLPEAAFIKGFYRAYAKHLAVDVSPIIASFDQLYTQQTGRSSSKELTESPLQIKGRLSKSNHRMTAGWLKWLLYLVVLLIVIMVIVAIVQKMKANKTESVNTASQVQVIDLNNTATTRTNTVTPANTPVQNGQDELNLEFKRPTSVHIVDAKGKVLASGRQANSLSLKGESPFQVRIDDATVTTLRLNNENIELKRYMVNGKVDFRLAR